MDELFRYECNLNIKGFIHMLDDPTECYKFYWLDSIMQLLSQDKKDISFNDVISGMIADAWYSVTEYHLRMGTRDVQGNSVNSIERAVNKLNSLRTLDNKTDRDTLLLLIKSQEQLLHDEKYQLSKNVPYRLLSSFLIEVGGNDPLWNQRTKLIDYLEVVNKKSCIPYIIGRERGLEKRIIIEEHWRKFLIDNMVSIRGWIQMKKINYLQDRNPGVPGIIYKLEPENESKRKLQNVRKLWSYVLKLNPVIDIYSGNLLDNRDYEIDHFVPWSFVTNDEMWNLIPTNGSLNSSKKDKLPAWEKYFKGFAKNQYMLNQLIYEYPEVLDAFHNCQRDNLNSLWSVEKLYVKGIKEGVFIEILESRLKPIYDSAYTQGYGIWMQV